MRERKHNPSQEWLMKLPQMSRRLEEELFRSAPSLKAYLDRTTLNTRLQQLTNDIRKRCRQAEDEKVKAGDPREEINNKDSIQRMAPQQQQRQQQVTPQKISMDEGEIMARDID